MQINCKDVKSVGGYIELQLPARVEYYPDLIGLNTGRNSLEYILKYREYTAVYLPYFTCDVLLEPIRRLNIEVNFYHINQDLDPVINFEIGTTECFVYTNYFGLKQQTVSMLAEKIKNLIVDNSQAFFSSPLKGVDTFYSCRKFFGVPDGAYLSTNLTVQVELEKDRSIERFSHLIMSIDSGIESGYSEYLRNNVNLVNNPIKAMSALTKRLLGSINYEECRTIRNDNFAYLHNALGKRNELQWNLSDLNAPLCYPFLINAPGLRADLINSKIFVPVFWPNVFEWASNDMYEYYLTNNLLCLPLDHRYDLKDMQHIIDLLTDYE